MKTRTAATHLAATALALTAALAGCTTYSKPVAVTPSLSPAAKGTDMQPARARLYNFLSDHGTMTMELSSGETCRGKWSSMKKQFAGIASGSLLLRAGDLAHRGVSVVGSEPTSRQGQATLHCDWGGYAEVEFVTRRGTADGYGIAHDSNDRYYLLEFGWP